MCLWGFQVRVEEKARGVKGRGVGGSAVIQGRLRRLRHKICVLFNKK